MSVRRIKRRDRNGAAREFWMVDVFIEHPDGTHERIRKVAPVQSRREAERYEREVRRAVLEGHRKRKEEREEKVVPTLQEFAKEFLSSYVATNNKPSEAQSKEMILRMHLVPAFGRTRLDAIGPRQIEAYKGRKLVKLSPKTVNNHLTVLRKLLAVAAEWGIIRSVPTVKWLRVPDPEFDFLDFEEAERLLDGAKTEALWHTMILTGLRSGLRQGELLALRWEDIDLVDGRLMVRRSVTRGIVTTPKSGKPREVPLSETLRGALKTHRHLRGELVFCANAGRMLGKNECRRPLWRACRRAGLRLIGWHVLRHTFASHLVMRGVPLKAVQELLGHATIEMTMRYAHLSPDVRRDAVRVLDQTETANGNRMATASVTSAN